MDTPALTDPFGVPEPVIWRIARLRQVAGDVEEIALLHVGSAAQMGAPHAAPIEDVSEGTLDNLGAQLEAFFCDARAQSRAIICDCPARGVVAMPTRETLFLRFGDPRFPGSVIEGL